jgi:hypothetical protein
MGKCVYGLKKDCEMVDKIGKGISASGLAKFCEICPDRLTRLKTIESG